MIQILVITHGKLASGLLSALQTITGIAEGIDLLELERDTHLDTFESAFLQKVSAWQQPGTLILTDIIGGSPYNISAKHLPDGLNYRLLSGVNLVMLIEAATMRDEMDLATLASHVVSCARQSIIDFQSDNPIPAEQKTETLHLSESATITLSRVDHRLFHGQVITKWVKLARATTVIIVDDELYQDEFMVDVILKSAPPGLQVIVAPVNVVGFAYRENTLPPGNIMLLFKNIFTVSKAYDEGLRLTSLQLGGIPNNGKKKMVFTAVSLDQDDITMLDKLTAENTEIVLQVVPEEGKMNYEDARKKIIIN